MQKIYQSATMIYRTDADEIKEALERILLMHLCAKKLGLLAVESFVAEEAEFGEKGFLMKAVGYLCDGMAPEKADKLLSNRILTQTDLKKQYLCLLYKVGVECIQAGEPVFCMKEVLCSLLPEACEAEMLCFMDQILEEESRKELEEKKKRLPGELIRIDILLPARLEWEMETFERRILQQKDDEIQSWLRQTENFDVCSLLLAGGYEFRNRILANMSERLRVMMMEDVIERGKELGHSYDTEVENVKRALHL